MEKDFIREYRTSYPTGYPIPDRISLEILHSLVRTDEYVIELDVWIVEGP